MIQPDAKCVVNGHKVNEVIDALNPLLNMDIIVGNVAQPQIQYSSGAVQIVIPPGGGASTNELLDIVDENNQASTRWFLTTTTQGSGGAAIASGTGTNIGSTGGKNNPAATKGDRDKLGGGIAGGPAGGKNRDNLDRAAASGGGGPIGGGNDGQGGNVGAPVQIDNPQNPSLSAEFEAQKLKIEKLDRESQVKSVDKMIYEQEMAKRLAEQEKMQEKYRLEQLAKNIK